MMEELGWNVGRMSTRTLRGMVGLGKMMNVLLVEEIFRIVE